MSLVDIILVTWNLPEYLYPCITSIYKNTNFKDFRVIVVNNGDPRHMDAIKHNHNIMILQEKENRGWEQGLKDALEYSDAPYVLFSNDDILIPDHQKDWLGNLLKHFVDPRIGAVGPTSNVVMGTQQIKALNAGDVIEVPFLINFFNLIRRKALDEAGGVDATLSGGDDLDQSIRMRKAGYRLLCDRNAFIWHDGFKSGTRKHGANYNAIDQVESTNFGLIRKHGLPEFLNLWKPIIYNPDEEGRMIASMIASDQKVIDLGCGTRKTVPWAIGMDQLPFGTPVPNVYPPGTSVADVVGDVTEALPFEPDSQDVIVARHVAEHFNSPSDVIKNWSSILRVGGKIFLAVPNEHLGDTLHMDPDHKHTFTPESMRVMMELLGFKTLNLLDPKNGVSVVGVFEKVSSSPISQENGNGCARHE